MKIFEIETERLILRKWKKEDRELLPNLEKPEQLIPLLAQQYLSSLSFTIFSCGLLAAIMSTADSYLLAGTSLVVNNIILKIHPIKTEKNKIKLLLRRVLFGIIICQRTLANLTDK